MTNTAQISTHSLHWQAENDQEAADPDSYAHPSIFQYLNQELSYAVWTLFIHTHTKQDLHSK